MAASDLDIQRIMWSNLYGEAAGRPSGLSEAMRQERLLDDAPAAGAVIMHAEEVILPPATE